MTSFLKLKQLHNEKISFSTKALLLIAFVFIVWSVLFIYRSSFIAADGKRYFSLFEDAMISMRYAWNFSHGRGLVWNLGEHVQGYSNFLMTIWMSFATWIFNKSNAVLFVQISGIPVLLGIALLNLKIAHHFFKGRPKPQRDLIRILAFAAPLMYFPLLYWTLMGMETGLISLFLLLSIFLALRYQKNSEAKVLVWIAVVTGLGILVRIDTLVFSLPLWALLFLDNSKKEKKWIVVGFLFYFLFLAGLLLFQHKYYGEWLPNTYTLKISGISMETRISNGFAFMRPFLVETAVILSLCLLDLILNFNNMKLLLFSQVLLGIAYQIYAGGDPWARWRMLAPFIPILFLLFIFTIIDMVQGIAKSKYYSAFFSRRIAPLPTTTLAILLSLLLGLLSVNTDFFREAFFLAPVYERSRNEQRVAVALALEQLTGDKASVAVFAAGTLPYYLDRRAIDFLGRSDRHIANLKPEFRQYANGMSYLPGHNKFNLRYTIRMLQPTYIDGYEWSSDSEEAFVRSHYVEAVYGRFTLLLLKDSPDVQWDKVTALGE